MLLHQKTKIKTITTLFNSPLLCYSALNITQGGQSLETLDQNNLWQALIPPALALLGGLAAILLFIWLQLSRVDQSLKVLAAQSPTHVAVKDDLDRLQQNLKTMIASLEMPVCAINARNDQLTQDQNKALEMILINQPLTRILTHLVETLERQRPEVRGAIFRRREQQLYHEASISLAPEFIEAINAMPVGPGAFGVAAYQGQVLVSPDLSSDPAWKDYQELALAHNLRSACAVPITSGKKEIVGLFVLFYHQRGWPGPVELELLESLERLAAIAIEQRELLNQLTYQSQHDPLTGLPNRLLLEDRLQQATHHARRFGKVIALLLVDLDRFKLINDTLGHQVGDLLLQQVGARLHSRVRQYDTVARMGGDEFCLILTDLTEPHDALVIAEKIIETFQPGFNVSDQFLHITASIGISLFPTDGESAKDLLRKADSALFRAKEHGRNQFEFFTDDMAVASLERMELERQLRKALERQELTLHYQPQVDMLSGQVVGLEALVRWNHPEHGLLPPGKFISIAEESGLIVPLGSWVLQTACHQNYLWQQAGTGPYKVAVNVSALQFSQPNFVDMVALALASSGLEPRWLELELTESLIMRNTTDTAVQLEKLRALGVGVAIDDFGTGYSSLSYLQQLPVDALKVDRSFVSNIRANQPDNDTANENVIIRAIIMLAHSLKMRVVAEGVETKDQLNFLRRLGCDQMQGYLFRAPMFASDLEDAGNLTYENIVFSLG